MADGEVVSESIEGILAEADRRMQKDKEKQAGSDR